VWRGSNAAHPYKLKNLSRREDKMNDCADILRVGKHDQVQQDSRRRNRTGLLKFAVRADLLICFFVIPIGAFIGSLWSIKPIAIALTGLVAVFVIACMRALRNSR
jgi:hypothetical protein